MQIKTGKGRLTAFYSYINGYNRLIDNAAKTIAVFVFFIRIYPFTQLQDKQKINVNF